MQNDYLNSPLPDTETELLDKFDEVANLRARLSLKIDNLSNQLGDSFSIVLKQRSADYKPLDDDIIEKSSENDKYIDEYYKLSSLMIEIENKLRKITKES